MPIYDYKCAKCDVKKVDEFVKKWDTVILCDNCKKPMTKLVNTRFTPDVFPAEGILLKNVSATGERFYSKNEMKRYAKEHDLELGALL